MKAYPAGVRLWLNAQGPADLWEAAGLEEVRDAGLVGGQIPLVWKLLDLLFSGPEKLSMIALGFLQKPGIWNFIWKLPTCKYWQFIQTV